MGAGGHGDHLRCPRRNGGLGLGGRGRRMAWPPPPPSRAGTRDRRGGSKAFAARFDAVPDTVQRAVSQTEDLDQLHRWLRAVVRARDDSEAQCAVIEGRPRPRRQGRHGYPVPARTPLRSMAEGGTLPVTVTATGPGGAPLAGVALQAFVNGQAWGAPEVTNGHGHALLPLPLPNPGPAHVVVATPVTHGDWTWGASGASGQTVYFARGFSLAGLAPSAIALASAQTTLQVAADTSFTAYINGRRVASGTSGRVVQTVGVAADLRLGTNPLAIRATGGQRGQGMLARLSGTTLSGGMTLHSDAAWRVWSTAPPAWPQPAVAAGSGALARLVAPAGGGVWADMPFSG